MGMYYSSAEIDENIVCAYCKQQFLDVVKLLPDCGESICGHCYEDLKDNVNAASDQFECLACKEMHLMPKKGLGDNKAILKLLNRKKITRPLNEQEDKLKRTLESLHCQLNELRLFDEREHVNHHCDMLEIEVIDEIDSLVKHLNEIGNNLLAEIRKYRERCLDKIEENKEEIQKRNAEDLISLSKELDQFGAYWISYFSRMDSVVSESKVKAAANKASIFEAKIKSFEQRIKSQAFNGDIILFKPSHSFLGPQDPLRKYLRLSDKKPTHRIQFNSFKTLSNTWRDLTKVLLLSKDCLVTCSKDEGILIWSIDKGEPIYELVGHMENVLSIEALKNGWLASGSHDMTIRVWNLDQRKTIRTLFGHTDAVISLKALKCGSLASYASDDIIKIWNPYTDEGNLILTIKGNGNVPKVMMFDSLSDGRFVTAIHDAASKEIFKLKVWHASNDRTTSTEIKTGLNALECRTMLVLSSDKVAIGCFNGTVKIVDLANEFKSILKLNAHSGRVCSLVEFSSGRLVSAGTNEDESNDYMEAIIGIINVWDVEAGMKLLQTIKTGHSDCIWTMSISPNEDILATGSVDNTIKLWNVTK